MKFVQPVVDSNQTIAQMPYGITMQSEFEKVLYSHRLL